METTSHSASKHQSTSGSFPHPDIFTWALTCQIDFGTTGLLDRVLYQSNSVRVIAKVIMSGSWKPK
jgi:hypothetical protein